MWSPVRHGQEKSSGDPSQTAIPCDTSISADPCYVAKTSHFLRHFGRRILVCSLLAVTMWHDEPATYARLSLATTLTSAVVVSAIIDGVGAIRRVMHSPMAYPTSCDSDLRTIVSPTMETMVLRLRAQIPMFFRVSSGTWLLARDYLASGVCGALSQRSK